jgi:hypothetical protein
MKILNLLGACSIVGDALALRMALVSNREAMSSLMPPKDCLILSRARFPWFRITRVTFYILLVILSIRLGEFMLKSLILFLTMLIYIRMRLLALGNQPMLNCLKRLVFGYPKVLVSNVKGPKTVWVPENKS